LIAAIVLAAGKSERMGSPKALLPINGQTFLENILSAISRTSIEETFVVVGHHRSEIEARVALRSVVFNAEYEKGMITSLQAGIRALPWDTSGAFLFLVDHPLVESTTIEAMIEHLAPNRIVLPVFEGRRGHPVLFASEVLQEILDLPVSQGANIVVHKDPARIVEVSVKAPGILVDIDTPEDFKKLQMEL
jgi:CTP:molybdopterin cytidylyltransferase MocA